MAEKTVRDQLVEIRTWARQAPDEFYAAAQVTAIWSALMVLGGHIDKPESH